MGGSDDVILNVGAETFVLDEEIIGIFDIDKLTVFKTNRDYLLNAEKGNRIVNVNENLPKSFVVCVEGELRSQKVYISPLLTSTLVKRIVLPVSE